MPIYRIRKCWGRKGGSNHYSHADVISRNHHLALKAAKEGRVNNWRGIDTFDTSSHDYESYELLGCVDRDEARNPSPPVPSRVHIKLCRLEEKVRSMDGVNGFAITQCDAVTVLARRSFKLRAIIKGLVCREFGPKKIRFYDR